MMTENLDAFFEFGNTVEIDDQEYKGILDAPDSELLGAIISPEYSLLMKSSDLATASIDQGDMLTVDDTEYKVKSFRKIDDGSITRVMLALSDD
jgi:hypothetical protein